MMTQVQRAGGQSWRGRPIWRRRRRGRRVVTAESGASWCSIQAEHARGSVLYTIRAVGESGTGGAGADVSGSGAGDLAFGP